jgi:hypothetical protein
MAIENALSVVALVLLIALVGFYVSNPVTEGRAPLIGSALIGAIVCLQFIQLLVASRR